VDEWSITGCQCWRGGRGGMGMEWFLKKLILYW
jgi:hypothetical protein